MDGVFTELLGGRQSITIPFILDRLCGAIGIGRAHNVRSEPSSEVVDSRAKLFMQIRHEQYLLHSRGRIAIAWEISSSPCVQFSSEHGRWPWVGPLDLPPNGLSL